jgi:tRNA-binding protein
MASELDAICTGLIRNRRARGPLRRVAEIECPRRRGGGETRAVAPHRIDPVSRPYAPESLVRKPDIGADGFFALDLRAGRVTGVEPFPEARKPSWKLTVDFGPVVGSLRTSAQITNYAADELRGRLVVGALNLGVKRIAGFTSEFLVLGALDPDGTVRLLELPDGVGVGAPIA